LIFVLDVFGVGLKSQDALRTLQRDPAAFKAEPAKAVWAAAERHFQVAGGAC